MKTVLLRGPVLTQSGYGVHCRQVARWLLDRQDLDAKFIVTPWGDTPWVLSESAFDGLAGQVMKRTVKPDFKADVSLQLQLPNEWDSKLAAVNVGITAGVETDRCHPSWVSACNSMHSVIVPSQHAKSSLTNTGAVTKPITVVPESYCSAISSPDLPQLPEFKTPFNFLLFGQITGNNPNNDRKNVFFTLKWICEAFRDDPSVGIVVKTNAGRNSKIDRNMVTVLLKQLLSEVRGDRGPAVYLLHGDMSDVEVAALYRHPQVKALVALTRGEGYGLPILEAAASGLPVIATEWSGHMDFLKHGKFVSIYYQLGDVHPSRVDDRIFVKGARWANPSEEDAKKRMLKFRQSPEVPTQWARELQERVLQLYSAEKIGEQYDSALESVLSS